MTVPSAAAGGARLRAVPSAVIMQPGTTCNLDCAYCYLPGRGIAQRMPVDVAAVVADTVNTWAEQRPGFEVFWHGGEPLAVGRRHFAALLAPFAGVSHSVQTNATLITDQWCDLLAEQAVRVGVSLDGPAGMSGERRTRTGRPAFDRIVRGIDCLRRNGIAFTALAVVSDPDPDQAATLYQFFVELGASALGVSIEQRVGANTRAAPRDPGRVAEFWVALAEAWQANPVIRVREIDRSLRNVKLALTSTRTSTLTDVDPLPTITWDGNVVLIAPELAGFHDPHYGNFASGNVLTRPLGTVLAAAGTHTPWLADHLAVVDACRTCSYSRFCDGPSPASSYFEHGRISPGATDHCRSATIALADAICRPLLTVGARPDLAGSAEIICV